MKRTFLFGAPHETSLVASGTVLIAATYGLVRLAYGLALPDVDRDLQLGVGLSGAVSAGASVAYCVGAVVGFLAGTRNPRGVVVLAGLSAGLGAVGMALAPSAGVFAPMAVLSSVGAGAASPALVTIVRRRIRGRDVDRAQATVNAGTGPGIAAAGVLVLLLPHWRTVWAVAAAVTAAAVVAVLLLDRRDDRVPRPTASGSAPEPEPALESESVAGSASVLPPWTWYRRHAVPLLAAVLLGAGSAAVWTFGRSHLAASGLGDTGSVLAWIALGLGGAGAVATAGVLSGRTPRAAWGVTGGALALGTVLVWIAPGVFVPAVLGCVLFGWGYTAATSALIAWAMRLDADRAAAGTSLLFIALVLGQSAGAAGAGALAGAVGLPLTILFGAVVSALAAAVPFLVRQPHDVPASDPTPRVECREADV